MIGISDVQLLIQFASKSIWISLSMGIINIFAYNKCIDKMMHNEIQILVYICVIKYVLDEQEIYRFLQ